MQKENSLVGTATIEEEGCLPLEHALFKGVSREVLAPPWPYPHTALEATQQTDRIHWLCEPISIWSGDLCVLLTLLFLVVSKHNPQGGKLSHVPIIKRKFNDFLIRNVKWLSRWGVVSPTTSPSTNRAATAQDAHGACASCREQALLHLSPAQWGYPGIRKASVCTPAHVLAPARALLNFGSTVCSPPPAATPHKLKFSY